MRAKTETEIRHSLSPEHRLVARGLRLPQVPAAAGNFDLGSIDGTTLYLSGQGPLLEDGNLARGKVGRDVSVKDARYHAMRTGLVLISAMKEILGSLEYVHQIHKLFGMVNAVPDFTEHPEVINGCSDLFCDIFGVCGRHARAAVGMCSLPGNISVEIEAIVSISPEWNLPS
ncbi:MAG: RidA family protein [Rhodobacteraceae bacterium]|nr:RidA family protein [Paracoccaceae bacterium]MCY4196095.1 RidA family protein [Paracoccaceae bacterium]MCY4327269.1 RidA family protein [Paracoccaceae bacterium]